MKRKIRNFNVRTHVEDFSSIMALGEASPNFVPSKEFIQSGKSMAQKKQFKNNAKIANRDAKAAAYILQSFLNYSKAVDARSK